MRRKVLGSLLVSMLLLVGANTAYAASASSVTIAYNTATMHFHGRVSSANAECVAHRTVRVYKVTPGGPVLQGTDTAGTRGGWTVDLMHAHGDYYAVAIRQMVMTSLCLRSRSATLPVM